MGFNWGFKGLTAVCQSVTVQVADKMTSPRLGRQKQAYLAETLAASTNAHFYILCILYVTEKR